MQQHISLMIFSDTTLFLSDGDQRSSQVSGCEMERMSEFSEFNSEAGIAA